MKSFTELKLAPALAKALKDMSFTKPTEIQAKAVPAILTGKDLIASAQTGTGKTAAFALPMISRLLEAPAREEGTSSTRALILVPTRELGVQVASVLKQLLAHAPEVTVAALTGGAPMAQQLKALKRRPQIVIATPGRLVDHLTHRHVGLDKVSTLVLDEADRMLDMGFLVQIRQIVSQLPKNRQTLLFSATFPQQIEQLASHILRKPTRIAVDSAMKAAKTVKQDVIQTTRDKKDDIMLDILNEREGSVLIFTRTRERADKLAEYLESYGYDVNLIHSGRTQGQRNAAIKGFREGAFRILVATDVAARGLDIANVAHVINYDLPQNNEDYVHRIGRTGRAERNGQALSLITPEDAKQWGNISKMVQRQKSQ